MTVRELHIEVSQATQNIASNTRRKFLSDEIDWLLNKNQMRFIQQRIKPRKQGGGFEVDEANADSIRTLYTRRLVTARLDSENNYQALLPGDYSYLTSDTSKVMPLCTGDDAEPDDHTESVLYIPLPNSTKSTGPFYSDTTITVGSTTLTMTTIAGQAESPFTGTRSKQEKYLIRDVLLWHLQQVEEIEVWWERYGSVYKPGCFLFPGKSSGNIVVDGKPYTGQTVATTYSSYADTGDWRPNRLVNGTVVPYMQATPFQKSDYRSPISLLGAGELVVLGSVSYIVTGVQLNYVRKPRRISLALGTSCELPEESHPAVCDLTVEYIKAMTADPNWEVKLKDNMLRSPLT